ncbi:MAG: cupin domain-containing protein [Betaproteobacteria bacterium]
MKTAYGDIAPFITRDGSLIRELMHPTQHGAGAMSFAEATVSPGETTRLHLHQAAEEIYHLTQGSGSMRLGDAEFDICRGDTITIAPGTPHCVTNTGGEPMKILCVCHPPYADDDTRLL